MIQVLTHRGLDPSKSGFFRESTYEAFEDQLLRGFGLEVDVQFTKDDEIVFLHDATLSRVSGGVDVRAVADLTLAELRSLSFDSSHIASFDELFALFLYARASGLTEGAPIAVHVKGHWQADTRYLDILLRKIRAHHVPLGQFFLFDVTPASAAYLKAACPEIQLAASVAHPYDIERYQACTHGTLLSVAELIEHRALYEWAWLDEWDRTDRDATEKAFYTPETLARLRAHGFKVALVTPELHGTSPGLLGGEAHPDGTDPVRREARFAEIVRLAPDAVCTDYPDAFRGRCTHDAALLERVPSAFSKWARIVTGCLSALEKRAKQRWIKAVEALTKTFVTVHERPRVAAEVGRAAHPASGSAALAVVIQGPILKDRLFTYETVRLYRKTFPDAQLILSTWDDEPHDVLAACRAAGATVVASPKPSTPGPSNVNYQLTSTFQGILAAERLGAAYVLKTRTDQRFYGLGIGAYLVDLVRHFPVTGGYRQRGRLVTLSFGTAKYHPYHFGDMFLFGCLEDMKRYWGFPLLPPADLVGPRRAFFNPEVHLAAAFLKGTGRTLLWTLEDAWRVYAEQVIVVDAASLDLYWHKYERWREHRERDYRSFARPRGCFTFHEWFTLYWNPATMVAPADPAAFFRGLALDDIIEKAIR